MMHATEEASRLYAEAEKYPEQKNAVGVPVQGPRLKLEQEARQWLQDATDANNWRATLSTEDMKYGASELTLRQYRWLTKHLADPRLWPYIGPLEMEE